VPRVLQRFANTLRIAAGDSICATWAVRNVEKNWGDKLNRYLIERLSGRTLIHANDVYAPFVSEIYGVIGSWLAFNRHPNLVAWGLGFIRSSDKITTSPKRICAVRGPKTLMKLRQAGYKVDDVAVGDPALLIPLLFTPKQARKKHIGVIPHHRDRGLPIFDKFAEADGYRVIDICSDTEDFCQQLAECEVVVSSSLHAVVAAHAYGIPARFIKVSDKPLGDGFKLLDYLESVGLEDCPPVACSSADDIEGIVGVAKLPRHFPDMGGLLAACPFMSESRKNQFREQADRYYRGT